MVPSKSTSDLIKSAEELFGDNLDSIIAKFIDPEKIKKYEGLLEILEKRKAEWAMSEKLSPIDSLRIYGAYNTLYAVFYGVNVALDMGIKKKENPKAAKVVYPLIQSSLSLVELVESVNLMVNQSKKPSTDLIDEIFHTSRKLYSDAIFKRVIQAGEIRNRQRLIERLAIEISEPS